MNTLKLQYDPSQLFREERYEEAIAFYEHCIETEPGNTVNYWYLGLAYFLRNESDTADLIWMSVLAQGNSEEEIEVWTTELVNAIEAEAVQYLCPGKLEVAQSLYEKIIEIHPTFLKGYVGLGIAYLQQKKVAMALAHLQQSITLKPDTAIVYHYIGLCLLEQGKLDEAIAQFTFAIELNPNSSETLSHATYYYLGICYKNKGDLERAIVQLYEAIRVDPNFAEAYCILGVCFVEQKKFDEAIFLFKKAITFKPSLVDAHFNLGVCFYEKHKVALVNAALTLDTAIHYLQQALILDPDHVKAHQSLGICWYSRSNFSEAIQHLDRAIQLQPDLDAAHLCRAHCLKNQGKFKAAIYSLQQAIKVHPDQIKLKQFVDELLECDGAGYFPLLHEGKLAWDAMLYKSVDQYHLFYLIGDSTANPYWSVGNLAMAVSPDLKAWKYLGVTLPTNPDSSWENGRMLAGSMHWEEDMYYFFYSAAPATDIMQEHIGLAISRDGQHWKRGNRPLIEPDSGFYCSTPSFLRGKAVQHRSWRDPYVFKEQVTGSYYLFISACCPGKNPRYQGCIGLAISDKIDGFYKLLPPAAYPVDRETGEGIYYELERPQVICRNGKYYLFFSATVEMINPQWLRRVGREHFQHSSLHWYVSDYIAGPYQPGAEVPIVKGSDRTYLYGTNLIEALDGELYAYGSRYSTQTLGLSLRYPVRWVGNVPEIVVDED